MDVPLEARETFSYDGRVVVRGQSFLARSSQDAKVLTLLNKAVEAPPPRHRRREATTDNA